LTIPLYFVAALAGASTPDPSVLDVYREACIDGQFQVTPDRGTVVERKRPPLGVFNFPDGPPGPDHTTYIGLKKPADTFVVIEQFESPKAKFESICRVTSRHWIEKDAQLAFIAGTSNPKVVDTRDPGHPYEPFIIDQPANGVRKKLFVHDPWVAVETGVYRQAK
jgi:hypothetical protein